MLRALAQRTPNSKLKHSNTISWISHKFSTFCGFFHCYTLQTQFLILSSNFIATSIHITYVFENVVNYYRPYDVMVALAKNPFPILTVSFAKRPAAILIKYC